MTYVRRRAGACRPERWRRGAAIGGGFGSSRSRSPRSKANGCAGWKTRGPNTVRPTPWYGSSPVSSASVETADMLVHEIFTRDLRDRRAVARYAGLTGSPDESGSRRRERGLSRAGNARVRRGMVQLAWRFLVFQKDSALVRWYRERTADGRGRTRMAMIVALARKLLIV